MRRTVLCAETHGRPASSKTSHGSGALLGMPTLEPPPFVEPPLPPMNTSWSAEYSQQAMDTAPKDTGAATKIMWQTLFMALSSAHANAWLGCAGTVRGPAPAAAPRAALRARAPQERPTRQSRDPRPATPRSHS